jgi:IS5 family transposase
MLGPEKPRGLFDVGNMAGRLFDKQSVHWFLSANREALFPEEAFADLFPSGRGRPSAPPAVMACVLLLQALEGKSDREAAEALTYDLRWKLACGWGLDVPGFHFSALSYWRGLIARSARPDRIWDALARVAAESGVLRGKRRRAVDSTVLDDAVARQDTATMVVCAARRVLALVPELAGLAGGLEGRGFYEAGGKPAIDWSDEAERDRLVSLLVRDAERLADAAGSLEGLDSRQLDAVGLLGVVSGQDVEPAGGSDGADGRWRIAKKTAPDRVISAVDPQSRHARKTRSAKRDGFKAHLVAEPDTGLTTAARLTAAAGPDAPDGHVGAELIREDPDVGPGPGGEAGSVDEVLGDGAYSSLEMLRACAELGVEPVIKPQPLVPAVGGGFTADDFRVDLAAGTATCPAGQAKKIPRSGQVKFSGCGSCPLRPRCTKSAARSFKATPEHLAQRAHRARVEARGEGFGDVYRSKRPMVERTMAWVTRRARRVPYVGVAKNNAWFRLRCAAVNLRQMVSMGLARDGRGWSVPGTG